MLAENIKRIREERRMPQWEVAKKMGTSQASISAYENGKKDPTYKTLCRLANVLECTVVDLVK